MTSIINDIPTTPQSWCRNPNGYILHQEMLVELAAYIESEGHRVELPEDHDGWDRGIDIIAAGWNIDLKTFGVCGKWNTWESNYYRGKEPSTEWKGCETDFFVHVTGDDVSQWIVGYAPDLRPSKYENGSPYYNGEVQTVAEFTERFLTNNRLVA